MVLDAVATDWLLVPNGGILRGGTLRGVTAGGAGSVLCAVAALETLVEPAVAASGLLVAPDEFALASVVLAALVSFASAASRILRRSNSTRASVPLVSGACAQVPTQDASRISRIVFKVFLKFAAQVYW